MADLIYFLILFAALAVIYVIINGSINKTKPSDYKQKTSLDGKVYWVPVPGKNYSNMQNDEDIVAIWTRSLEKGESLYGNKRLYIIDDDDIKNLKVSIQKKYGQLIQ